MARTKRSTTSSKESQLARVINTSHEVMRRQLDGLQLIEELEQCAQKYITIEEELCSIASLMKRTKDRNALSKMKHRVSVLKARADVVDREASLHLRRLRFVLPEYQAVKYEERDGAAMKKKEHTDKVIDEARNLLELVAVKRGEIAKH